jgi:hypothetical protein
MLCESVISEALGRDEELTNILLKGNLQPSIGSFRLDLPFIQTSLKSLYQVLHRLSPTVLEVAEAIQPDQLE